MRYKLLVEISLPGAAGQLSRADQFVTVDEGKGLVAKSGPQPPRL